MLLPAQIFLSPGTSENYTQVRIVPLGGDLSQPVSLAVFAPPGFTSTLAVKSALLTQGEQRVGLSLSADSSVPSGKYQLNLETTAAGVSRNTSFNILVVTKVVFMFGAQFIPADVTVGKGSTVAWVDLDGPLSQYDPGTHNVVFNDGPASASMSQYDTYTRAFTSPGTYMYVCTYHPGMDGLVVVTGG